MFNPYVSFEQTEKNMKVVGRNLPNFLFTLFGEKAPRRIDMKLNEFCNMSEELGFSDYYDLITVLEDCGEWNKAS